MVDDLGARTLAVGNLHEQLGGSTVSLVGRRIALSLEQLRGSISDVLVTSSLQPLVIVMCTDNVQGQGTTNITFGDGNEDGLKNLMDVTDFKRLGTTIWASGEGNASARHTLLWQAPPTDASAHSILFAENSWDTTLSDMGENGTDFGTSVKACVLDAYWVQSTINFSISTQDYTFKIDDDNMKNKLHDLISIPLEWAEKLTSLWLSVASSDGKTGGVDLQEPVSAMMPELLAIGISDAVAVPRKFPFEVLMNPPVKIQNGADCEFTWEMLKETPSYRSGCYTNQQIDALSNLIADTGLEKKYDSIQFSIASNWTDASALTQLDVHGYTHGYGYDSSTVPVQLSLTVLALYCLIVVLYLRQVAGIRRRNWLCWE